MFSFERVVQVVGKQVCDYVDYETKKEYKCLYLFYIYSDDVVGFKADKKFVAATTDDDVLYKQAMALDLSQGPLVCRFQYLQMIDYPDPILEGIEVIQVCTHLMFYDKTAVNAGKGGFFMDVDVVKVVGKQVLDFVNQETGEKIQGVNLFILTPAENVDGLKAVKQFIGTSSAVYGQALNLDCSGGMLDCRFNYSYRIGQKKPTLTSIEIL